MKIAIFSDSHDHLSLVEQAIAQVKERGITTAFHLGDFCAPPIATALAESGLKWFCVWGNVDGDKLLMYKRTQGIGHVDFADGDFREIEMEGRKLFLTHYPDIARLAAVSGEYDAAFFGHNHKASAEVITSNGGPHAQVLLANPGELAGFRFGTATYGIYDTESNTLEHITLK